MISDYAVIIAILVFATIDNAFHLQTPKLLVPVEFKVIFRKTFEKLIDTEITYLIKRHLIKNLQLLYTMFSLQPTHPDRKWLIPFTHPSLEWYMYIAAALPSLLLTILLFMDQQITSVIVNRKEHKLQVFIS